MDVYYDIGCFPFLNEELVQNGKNFTASGQEYWWAHLYMESADQAFVVNLTLCPWALAVVTGVNVDTIAFPQIVVNSEKILTKAIKFYAEDPWTLSQTATFSISRVVDKVQDTDEATAVYESNSLGPANLVEPGDPIFLYLPFPTTWQQTVIEGPSIQNPFVQIGGLASTLYGVLAIVNAILNDLVAKIRQRLAKRSEAQRPLMEHT